MGRFAKTTMGVLLFSLLTLACAREDGGGGGTTSPRVIGGGEPTSTTTSITFNNRSDVTVYYLYVSPSSSSDWGPDQLGSRVLAGGESFRLNGVPCDTSYDFKFEGPGHDELLTRYEVWVACGSPFTVNLN